MSDSDDLVTGDLEVTVVGDATADYFLRGCVTVQHRWVPTFNGYGERGPNECEDCGVRWNAPTRVLSRLTRPWWVE